MSLLPVPFCSPLADLFPNQQHSVIQIPQPFLSSLLLVGQRYVFPNIANFHLTTPLQQVELNNASLNNQGASLYMSKSFDNKSGVFLIDTPEYAVLGFGRQLFSNFVQHKIEVKTPWPSTPLILPCGEAIFKLACCTAHAEDPGFQNATQTIFNATKPEEIKDATKNLQAFNPRYWDAQSENAMATTVCLLATDPQFFADLQNILLLLKGGRKFLHVIEFNPFDAIWGVKRPVAEALQCITSEYNSISHGSLEGYITSQIIGSNKNQLGNAWTRLLHLLPQFPTYDVYKEAVDELNVLQII